MPSIKTAKYLNDIITEDAGTSIRIYNSNDPTLELIEGEHVITFGVACQPYGVIMIPSGNPDFDLYATARDGKTYKTNTDAIYDISIGQDLPFTEVQ